MIDDEFLQLEFYYDLFIGGIHNFSRKPPISVRPKIYTPGINSITSWQFNFDLETNSKQVFTRKRRTGIKKNAHKPRALHVMLAFSVWYICRSYILIIVPKLFIQFCFESVRLIIRYYSTLYIWIKSFNGCPSA